MAKQRFLALFLVTALLALSFSSQGRPVEARKVQVQRAAVQVRRSPLRGRLLPEAMAAYTTMDYGPPTANTKTHGGMIPSPDPSTPSRH